MEGLREGQGNESLEPAEVERVVGFVMQAIAGDVRRIAAAMVLKRDDELLGPGEFDLREKMLQAASHILEATLVAMKEAVLKISPSPDYLLIDGISKIPLPVHQRTIKKGDSASISIAAASIIAKVTRDRLMVDFDHQYPGYGFAEHKGYGTPQHLAAIQALGPCPIHRRSFSPFRPMAIALELFSS